MKTDVLLYHTRWWNPKKVKEIMMGVGFEKVNVKFIDFNLKIAPKISISLIKEWQRREYNFTKNVDILQNVELQSFLNSHKTELERYGLEFPTEYIIFGKK